MLAILRDTSLGSDAADASGEEECAARGPDEVTQGLSLGLPVEVSRPLLQSCFQQIASVLLDSKRNRAVRRGRRLGITKELKVCWRAEAVLAAAESVDRCRRCLSVSPHDIHFDSASGAQAANGAGPPCGGQGRQQRNLSIMAL